MVDNTDAEGRLVLIDGLARAGEEGATHVVDIATLTGAVVRALGPSVAGVMGTDRGLVRRVIRSGENHGEPFWELPLVEEYRDSLKTPYADLNNIAAGGLAGAITAGLFLREFVPHGRRLGAPRHRRARCSRTRSGSTSRPARSASASRPSWTCASASVILSPEPAGEGRPPAPAGGSPIAGNEARRPRVG